MSKPLVKIIPVMLGGTASQDVWQRLNTASSLSSIAQVLDAVMVGAGGITTQIELIARADIAAFVLGAATTDADTKLLLHAFNSLEKERTVPKGVLLVFETQDQLSKAQSPFLPLGLGMVSADNPTQANDVLKKFAEEIQSGSRLPVSRFARELKPPTGAPSNLGGQAGSKATRAEPNAPSEPPRQEKTETGESTAEAEEEATEPGDIGFELKESDFTNGAWDVLGVARRLGFSRPRPQVCSLRRLIASLLFLGLGDKRGLHSGAWLVGQIKNDPAGVRQRLGKTYPLITRPGSSFGTLLRSNAAPAPAMTEALKRTLDLAQRLATETRPAARDRRIAARHLLGAALCRTEGSNHVERFLRNFGLNKTELRDALIRALPDWGVEDDSTVWMGILDPQEPKPEEHGLPTYAADSALGDDLIGITREVEAMASLVSAWSVEPPLSIGLFGEWGSGKSFFMQKMKERVRQIASQARKSGAGQMEFGYYKNIVQVEFNAWHYVEGNLWASLVEHIFSNLRLEGIDEENVDSEEHLRKRLEKLLGEVKEKTAEAEQKEKKAEKSSQQAELKKQQAEAEASRLEAEAAAARARMKTAEEEGRKAEQKAADKQRAAEASVEARTGVGLKDIVEEVAGSAEIRELVQKDLDVLGFTKDRLATVQGLRETLKEASEAGTVLGQGLRIVAEDRQRWSLLAWVVAGPAVAAALVWAGAWLVQQQNAPWLQALLGMSSALATVVSGAVGFWKRYSPKLQPVLNAVAQLKQKRAMLEQRVEEARQKRVELAVKHDEDARRKREEADAEQQLAEQKSAEAEAARQAAKEKQEEADRAKQAAQSARAEAERLRRDAEALLPERRIAAFIQDRAGAKDYRRHLGVPALIRRDFEKLSAMFRSQRKQEQDGLDGQEAVNRNDLSIVNRIILYIDDLDRCPQEKVVEVLRAIHLLLAFPLFVVVVAVDARWMKRSLRDRFSLMLTTPQEAKDANRVRTRSEDLALGAMATPDDYLEKIFQVPFWIRPLSKSSCRDLVNALTKDDLESPDVALETKAHPKEGDVTNAGENKPAGAGVEEDSTKPADPGALAATGASATGTTPPQESGASGEAFQWSVIEPRPRTLQLSKEEREYMVELAAVIGRSPRSVKRFVNCYRLLKSALDKKDLARATRDGTFRTTMLLLGVVTGLPDMAPALLADLRHAARSETPVEWAHKAARRLKLGKQGRFKDLLPAIVQLHKVSKVSTISPLVDAANLVDRFSFSPVRTPSAGG